MGGKNRPAGRAGFHQANGKFSSIFQADYAAAGVHQKDWTSCAFTVQTPFETAQISFHQGFDIGIGDGGVETLIFAHLRADLARQRQHGAGHFLRHNLSHEALMGVIDVGMEKSHSDALKARLLNLPDQGFDLSAVDRL